MLLNNFFHNACRLTAFLFALVLALCLIPVQGSAQEKESEPETPGQVSHEVDPARLEKRLKEVRELLNVAESQENEQTAAQLGTTLAQLQERNALLRSLEAVYLRLHTSFNKTASLKKEEKNLEETLTSEKQSLVPESPPYSLSTYDSFLDRLTTARQREESSRGMVKFIKKVIQDSRDSLDLAGQELRKVREQLESEGIEEKTLISNWKYKFARLKEEQAEVYLNVQRVSRENARTETRIAQLSTQIAQKNVEWIKSNLAYDQEDLNKHLDALKERRKQLKERIAALMTEQRGVETKWLEAQREVERTQTGDALASTRSTALLEAREAWRETYQKVLERSEIMNQVLNLEEKIWQRRYALLTPDTDYEEMDAWESEMASFNRNAEQGIHLMQRDQANIQSQIATLKAQLSKEELDPVTKQHMETRLAALQKSAERTLEFMSMVLGVKELHRRLIDEIDAEKRTVSLKEKIEGLGDKIHKLWDFELWVINERSVTVRKVVVALAIFIVGMLLIRIATPFIRRRLSASKRLDQTAASALSKVLYYLALTFLVLFAMRTVNIPLTAFTFAGGAIAIGLGFGAQNLLNNFISGFILMIERPVKIGDMIEVDNTYGLIEEIGSRCTRIRTTGNIHILVPNSSFLEKNIINWTLADQMIRTDISVGVVYGSDTRKVKQLMLKAAGEHGKVLKDPEPFILFKDFGDNALIFKLFFWISMKRLMDRRVIESDLRFIIDELFREAGIVIAFPQRDIHLDTTKPLDLRIVKNENEISGKE